MGFWLQEEDIGSKTKPWVFLFIKISFQNHFIRQFLKQIKVCFKQILYIVYQNNNYNWTCVPVLTLQFFNFFFFFMDKVNFFLCTIHFLIILVHYFYFGSYVFSQVSFLFNSFTTSFIILFHFPLVLTPPITTIGKSPRGTLKSSSTGFLVDHKAYCF